MSLPIHNHISDENRELRVIRAALLGALQEARPLVERFANEEARANKVRGAGTVHKRREQLARLDAAIAKANGQ